MGFLNSSNTSPVEPPSEARSDTSAGRSKGWLSNLFGEKASETDRGTAPEQVVASPAVNTKAPKKEQSQPADSPANQTAQGASQGA